MSDRHVHIRLRDGREVVRYDRAGKWYIEHPDGRRFWLKFAEAVSWANDPGAEVFTGLPGGSRFDRAVSRR
jgi:hypothetical protein